MPKKSFFVTMVDSYIVPTEEWDLEHEVQVWSWLPQALKCLNAHDSNFENCRKFKNDLTQLECTLKSVEDLVQSTAGDTKCVDVQQLARSIKFTHTKLTSCNIECERLGCESNYIFPTPLNCSTIKTPCAVSALVNYSENEVEILQDTVYMLVDNTDPVWWTVEALYEELNQEFRVPSVIFRHSRDCRAAEFVTRLRDRAFKIWTTACDLFLTKAKRLLLRKISFQMSTDDDAKEISEILNDETFDLVSNSDESEGNDFRQRVSCLIATSKKLYARAGNIDADSSIRCDGKTWCEAMRSLLMYIKMSNEYLKYFGNCQLYQRCIGYVEDVNLQKRPQNACAVELEARQRKLSERSSELAEHRDNEQSEDESCHSVSRKASSTQFEGLCNANKSTSCYNGDPVSRSENEKSAKYRNVSSYKQARGIVSKLDYANKCSSSPICSDMSRKTGVKPQKCADRGSISEEGCIQASRVTSCCGGEASPKTAADVYESKSCPVTKTKFDGMTSKCPTSMSNYGSRLNKSVVIANSTDGVSNMKSPYRGCRWGANLDTLASQSWDNMISLERHRAYANSNSTHTEIISHSQSIITPDQSNTRIDADLCRRMPDSCVAKDGESEPTKLVDLYSSSPNSFVKAGYCEFTSEDKKDSGILSKKGSRAMWNEIETNSDYQFEGPFSSGISSHSVLPAARIPYGSDVCSSMSLEAVRQPWSYREPVSCCSDNTKSAGQTTETREFQKTHPKVSKLNQLHEVETLLHEFSDRCSNLPVECGGAENLNNVELRLLGQFESVGHLCRERLEKQRRALDASEAFHSMVHIAKSMTSSLCNNRDFDGVDDQLRCNNLLNGLESDFDKLLANTEKLGQLKEKADQLIEYLHEIEFWQTVEKSESKHDHEDTVHEDMWDDPIATNVVVKTASNVANGQLDDVEVGIEKMVSELNQDDLPADMSAYAKQYTIFKSDPNEMIDRCHGFEQTLDCLKEIVDSAPEFLELHCVEKRMELIRDKLSGVKQLTLFSKFTALHDMLQSALTTLQDAFDGIEVPQVDDGEQCIVRFMREAQLVHEAALTKMSAIDDLFTVGQHMSEVLSADLSQKLLKAIKKTKIKCRVMETKFKQKVQELKKLLQLSGTDLMAYGSFNLMEWKKRFTSHLHEEFQRPIDFFRKLTKGVTSTITRRVFVNGIARLGCPTTLEEIYCVFDLMDITCTNQVSHQEFNNIMIQNRPTDNTKLDISDMATTVEETMQKAVEIQSAMCTCSPPFKAVDVGNGQYEFGDRRKKYRLKVFANGSVLIRVGSGWEALAELFEKIDPCRGKTKGGDSVRSVISQCNRNSSTVNISDSPKTDVNSKRLSKSSQSFSPNVVQRSSKNKTKLVMTNSGIIHIND